MARKTISRRQALKATGILVGAGAALKTGGIAPLPSALRHAVHAASASTAPRGRCA